MSINKITTAAVQAGINTDQQHGAVVAPIIYPVLIH